MHPLREIGDRCEAGQIERFAFYLGTGHFATNLLDSRLPLPIVAAGQNDLCTGFGQGQGCFVTETARSSRDDRRSAESRRDFGLCRTSHDSTLLERLNRFARLWVTFGSAGSGGWWGGSDPYQSRGRRY